MQQHAFTDIFLFFPKILDQLLKNIFSTSNETFFCS